MVKKVSLAFFTGMVVSYTYDVKIMETKCACSNDKEKNKESYQRRLQSNFIAV